MNHLGLEINRNYVWILFDRTVEVWNSDFNSIFWLFFDLKLLFWMKYFDCDYNLLLFFLASIFKWFLGHSIFTQTFIGTLNFEILSFLIEFVTSSFDFIFIVICVQTQFLLNRGLILHICPIFFIDFWKFQYFFKFRTIYNDCQ